ncbi:MAG TPA: DUF2017 family protein [Mycobacteriales bacterium]|nr:DUF2017 family protein [Mycobacteriales bacterium]
MTAFRRTGAGVVVTFDEVEASLLRHLVGEVRDLLDTDADLRADLVDPAEPAGGPAAESTTGLDVPDAAMLAEMTGLGGGPPPRQPGDPVLRRLLPDGYRDDAAAADEFRRFTEASLREQKRAVAVGLLEDLPGDAGGEVRLDPPTVERWLSALNDVRLALGTRIGVEEDMPEPDPDDPDTPAYVVYLWLTELQEVLVQVAAEAAEDAARADGTVRADSADDPTGAGSDD